MSSDSSKGFLVVSEEWGDQSTPENIKLAEIATRGAEELASNPSQTQSRVFVDCVRWAVSQLPTHSGNASNALAIFFAAALLARLASISINQNSSSKHQRGAQSLTRNACVRGLFSASKEWDVALYLRADRNAVVHFNDRVATNSTVTRTQWLLGESTRRAAAFNVKIKKLPKSEGKCVCPTSCSTTETIEEAKKPFFEFIGAILGETKADSSKKSPEEEKKAIEEIKKTIEALTTTLESALL